MAEQPTQNFANHAFRPTLSAWAAGLSLLAVVCFLVEMFRRPSLLALGLLAVAASAAVLTAISRIYIVRLQDRIIRLEMRLRLGRLGRDADFARLTHRQLVALRFAPDAELPALIDRALAERLDSKQIKQAIRDWHGDYYRT
jgi:hypothetical protein